MVFVHADGSRELCCSPAFEASIYSAFEPPPAADFSTIECRVAVAVGKLVPGVHERLVVLSTEVAGRIRRCQLLRMDSLSHLGPFERPEEVAGAVQAALLGAG